MGLVSQYGFGRVRRIPLSLVAVLISLGCADPAPQVSKQVIAGHSGEDAELVVLNASGPTLIASNLDVVNNGALIVSLARLTYQTVRVAPGVHEFRFKEWPTGARFARRREAEPRKTYYLVVADNPARSMALPFAGDSMAIRIVTEEQAKPLMKEMKPK